MGPDPQAAPALGERGQILVSAAALGQYMVATGAAEHEREECRRDLTETLIRARPREGRPDVYRRRDRGLGVDIEATIAVDGELLVVTRVHVRGAASSSEVNARRRIVR